jgi:hypothetical protein
MFGYRKALLIFALILLLDNCFSSEDGLNENLIDQIPNDDENNDTLHAQNIEMHNHDINPNLIDQQNNLDWFRDLTPLTQDNMVRFLSRAIAHSGTFTDDVVRNMEQEFQEFEITPQQIYNLYTAHQIDILYTVQEIEMQNTSPGRNLLPRHESGQNMQRATTMMQTFCTMLNVKKSTKFELLKKFRNSDQQKFENIDNEMDQQDLDPYYDVVDMSPECETLYLDHVRLFGADSAEEIKKYFYIICTHIAGLFGEESVKLERHDRIFKTAETYSKQCAQDMYDNKWKVNKKKLFSPDEWTKVQKYCTNYLDNAEQLPQDENEKFIKLKQLILTKMLDYYGDIAQAQEVDVITQAWTFLIVKRPKKWYQWWKWKSECDLPHRRPVQAEEGYVTMYTLNPKAVVLAAGSFLIQIMVPLTIIFHHFLKNKNKFCPQGIFDMPYGEISTPEFYYIYVTKFAALILSYYLNAVLKADFNKGKEIFSKNWTSKALSMTGLFGGRLQNIFSYILVLLTIEKKEIIMTQPSKLCLKFFSKTITRKICKRFFHLLNYFFKKKKLFIILNCMYTSHLFFIQKRDCKRNPLKIENQNFPQFVILFFT